MTVVKIDSYLQSGCNDNSFSMKIIDNNDNSSHKMVGNVFVTRQRWFMIMKCQIRLSTFKIFVFIIVRNHSYRNEQKGPYSKSQSDHRGCGSIWLFELFFFFFLVFLMTNHVMTVMIILHSNDNSSLLLLFPLLINNKYNQSSRYRWWNY